MYPEMPAAKTLQIPIRMTTNCFSMMGYATDEAAQNQCHSSFQASLPQRFIEDHGGGHGNIQTFGTADDRNADRFLRMLTVS